MWQAHWLEVQGQDQALGRRQPEVRRTLDHQGPNLGLGVKVEPCPGSSLGCWVGLQILIQEEGPRQSPRPITQANHKKEKLSSGLLGWLALAVTQGARVPLVLNEPKLEGNRKRKQETGPGFLSVCYMWDESGRRRGWAWKLLAIKQIRFLIIISNCLLDISPRLSNKHSRLPCTIQNFWFIILSPFNLTLPWSSPFH